MILLQAIELKNPESEFKIMKYFNQFQRHSDEENALVGQEQTNTTMRLDKYADQTVATVTLVEGQDVTDLTPSSIIAQIKARKKAVRELTEAGITGAYIEREKAEHEKAIIVLLDTLNGSVPTSASVPEL